MCSVPLREMHLLLPGFKAMWKTYAIWAEGFLKQYSFYFAPILN